MNIPTSTPFPVPTFKNPGSDASPQQFIEFLHNLISENLDGDPSVRIPVANREAWVTVILGLADHFIVDFPPYDATPWIAIHEKAKLAEVTLEIIQRVITRVEGVFLGPSDVAKQIFVRVFNLYCVLDVWAEVQVPEDDVLKPTELRKRAFQVTTGLLRSLGSNVTMAGGSDVPTWRILRTILIECLEVSYELVSHTLPLTYPLTVALFNNPRLREVSEGVPFPLIIARASQLPAFLNLVLSVLVNGICPAVLSQWFLTDLVRRITEAARNVFDYCLSPSCLTTPAKRTKALAQIVVSVTPLFSLATGFEIGLNDLRYRLLRHRLDEGPRVEWDIIDPILLEVYEAPLPQAPLRQNINATLEVMQNENWGDTGKGLRALAITYLRTCLPHLDVEALREMKSLTLATPKVGLVEEIEQLVLLKLKPSEGSREDGETRNWRLQVRTSVQGIISPDQIDWMDDDDTLSDQQYAQRALGEVKNRFERPLNVTSARARISLAEGLMQIPCLIAHFGSTECSSKSGMLAISIIPSYYTVMARLLDGGEDEVTPAVRRYAYDAFSRTVRHHALDSSVSGLEHATDIIIRGIIDKNRSVRLSAGRCLDELIKIYEEDGSGVIETIFAHLYRLFGTIKDQLRETVLVTVGSIGKSPNPEVLGQCVCFLIAQLGKQNPVIRGVAYMQVLAMAKHHKKSTYSLVHPYIPQIAPFLVSCMCTQPSLLAETCRLIAVVPTDFLSTTLSRTLPQLFANCELKVLEAIAKDLTTKPSSLFLNYSHEILAHVFLLPGPIPTNKALTFILKVLTDATGNATIDIQSVVKSCIVPLLADLVIVMGDENKGTAARDALTKVERTLCPPSRGARASPSNLGAFLKGYMLGVISAINEMLQDVQGKKSMVSKQQILRSLGALVVTIGPSISNVAPQIMATFQTMVGIPELAEVTLDSWHKFLSTLGPSEIGPHVGPTSAALISSWPAFSPLARKFAKKSLDHIIFEVGTQLEKYLDEVVDLSAIPELHHGYERLKELRGNWTPREKLQRILERTSSDNVTVASQSLGELEFFMRQENKEFIEDLASGDVFDPLVGQILSALFAAACRDGDGTEGLHLLAFECIGILGAVDPDRCEIGFNDPRMIMLDNFMDEGESVRFALHLITDLLVGAFRSTSDIKYQSHLAYSIQELLRFCKFTPALVAAGNNNSIPLKVRKRWSTLPKHVLETVTPLLEARFTLNLSTLPDLQHPIYPDQSTYREWIQLWTTHLITKAAGPTAQTIFGVFRSAVRNKDVGVAHHLLPHLVLNILISGNEDDAQCIRSELLAVLEDQVDTTSSSTSDKKLLSAQAVFMLLDHLNKWVRIVRQDLSTKKADSKRSRANSPADEQLLRVDSILSSIDQNLMAKAALQCKAYARSLMNFERQILTLRERAAHNTDLPVYYERLHEIYAHLDEPDGMEGVSTLILSPSLEHQIRQHESTGQWTSAQSCWEVRLQQSPDNVDFHLGLLRCLRNLGHYDTLRTHVRGVLTRNPDWESALVGFQVESAWMVGAWTDVQHLVDHANTSTSPIVMARLLLSMRTGDATAIATALSAARAVLGGPITAAGVKGYRRSYEAVLDLHITHELEVINNVITCLPTGSQANSQTRREVLTQLSRTLSARLDATFPTFRTREPVLSMRRTAFALSSAPRQALTAEIGKSWLASAKIARKAGQWQTAYSAMLQARQGNTHFSFMESAKLVKATGEPLRALQELENSMRLLDLIEDNPNVLDLTEDDDETKKMKAKAQVLRARWMNESDRFEHTHILKAFQNATDLWPKWESGQYHLGQFHDESFKNLPPSDQATRGTRMNLYTVRFFAKAIKYGSKYVYQTVPRLLTIWLDLGEDRNQSGTETFKKLNDAVARAIKDTPVYKWFTAFPQIVSRVGHSNPDVVKHLSRLIVMVMQEYPKQALWLFTSVVKSTKHNRQQRGKSILDQLRNNPNNARTQVPMLVSQCLAMTNELLALCDYHIDDSKKTLSMGKDFPRLAALGQSPLIIPLQESLTASLPPTSSSESLHQPFPPNAPTFGAFLDEIDVMRSLAKPRKITIIGSNGLTYMFLGKPKDDLRKDARLMDFNAIINKLLKANSESRRRQLHIRTYGVVTLNEECGFIQWVPDTIPIRPVLVSGYKAKQVVNWSSEMESTFKKIKDLPDREAGQLYVKKILPMFPPVFHEWFIETFPEPSAWLSSRLAYGRTAAVMSMVGFILGLGDRHCENILLDTNTGDVVHVDFNCLFEKGKSLETPERVPFRLTQNLVDGLGVTGVEGVFRIACEVTMQLLRDNKDSLMSVLDAFIHDPLVEWEDEKRKLERDRNSVKSSVDLRMLAKNALNRIEKKVKGIYSTSKERQEKEISTSNLVQMLIEEATDSANLAKMYPGWASWH